MRRRITNTDLIPATKLNSLPFLILALDDTASKSTTNALHLPLATNGRRSHYIGSSRFALERLDREVDIVYNLTRFVDIVECLSRICLAICIEVESTGKVGRHAERTDGCGSLCAYFVAGPLAGTSKVLAVTGQECVVSLTKADVVCGRGGDMVLVGEDVAENIDKVAQEGEE